MSLQLEAFRKARADEVIAKRATKAHPAAEPDVGPAPAPEAEAAPAASPPQGLRPPALTASAPTAFYGGTGGHGTVPGEQTEPHAASAVQPAGYGAVPPEEGSAASLQLQMQPQQPPRHSIPSADQPQGHVDRSQLDTATGAGAGPPAAAAPQSSIKAAPSPFRAPSSPVKAPQSPPKGPVARLAPSSGPIPFWAPGKAAVDRPAVNPRQQSPSANLAVGRGGASAVSNAHRAPPLGTAARPGFPPQITAPADLPAQQPQPPPLQQQEQQQQQKQQRQQQQHPGAPVQERLTALTLAEPDSSAAQPGADPAAAGSQHEEQVPAAISYGPGGSVAASNAPGPPLPPAAALALLTPVKPPPPVSTRLGTAPAEAGDGAPEPEQALAATVLFPSRGRTPLQGGSDPGVTPWDQPGSQPRLTSGNLRHASSLARHHA